MNVCVYLCVTRYVNIPASNHPQYSSTERNVGLTSSGRESWLWVRVPPPFLMGILVLQNSEPRVAPNWSGKHFANV